MNKPITKEALTQEISHCVAGREVRGSSGRFGEVFNPATGEVTARVPLAGTSWIPGVNGAGGF